MFRGLRPELMLGLASLDIKCANRWLCNCKTFPFWKERKQACPFTMSRVSTFTYKPIVCNLIFAYLYLYNNLHCF